MAGAQLSLAEMVSGLAETLVTVGTRVAPVPLPGMTNRQIEEVMRGPRPAMLAPRHRHRPDA